MAVACREHVRRNVSLASAFGRQRFIRRDGRDDFGGGALHEFEALKQHTGVTIPHEM